MAERKEGFYWVRYFYGWEAAEWDGTEWWLSGAYQGRKTSVLELVGPRIPAPDETVEEDAAYKIDYAEPDAMYGGGNS